jgi:hypothetical protein
MAQRKMLYIELKTNQNHRGPAWITLAAASEDGRTVYFKGKTFSKMRSTECGGNHFDEETYEKYFISDARKDGRDRHGMGGGVIMIDSKVLDDYLAFRGLNKLDPNNYKVVTIEDTDTSRFDEMGKNRK